MKKKNKKILRLQKGLKCPNVINGNPSMQQNKTKT